MNLVGRLRAAKKAEAKAAATAPAKFRRITPETEITVPCVLARVGWNSVFPEGLRGELVNVESEVCLLREHYTHWLPIEWPEVRG